MAGMSNGTAESREMRSNTRVPQDLRESSVTSTSSSSATSSSITNEASPEIDTPTVTSSKSNTKSEACNGENNPTVPRRRRLRECAQVARKRLRGNHVTVWHAADLRTHESGVFQTTSSNHSTATESNTESSREGSCEQNECLQDKTCCLSIVQGCASNQSPSNTKSNGFYHISKGEHACQSCYEEISRVGRPLYDCYIEWKNRWVAESRCAPFVRLFILDELLPFWIQCVLCGKFRRMDRSMKLTAAEIGSFICAQAFPDFQHDPCQIPEEVEVSEAKRRSWIKSLSAPPLLHNSPALHYLRNDVC
ncbi:CW-type zinc finger domain-containing protein [Ditylenchus destructor]|nr:CW-type zinc finger domain-containing protein [Ditylenchus destructor]